MEYSENTIARSVSALVPTMMLVTASTLVFAVGSAPWFGWKENYLSDLGVHTGSMHYFNAGLMASGIVGLTLAYALWRWTALQKTGWYGPALIGAGSVFLSLIGVFTEDAGVIHYYVSVAFFVLYSFGMMALGITQRRHSAHHAYFMVLMGLINIPIWAFPWPGAGGAIPEALSMMAFFASYMAQSDLVVKTALKKKI